MACDDAPKAAKQAMRLNSGELERRFKSHCFPQRNQQGCPEYVFLRGEGGCHDVKEDFWLKAWLVAGGHVLPPPLESVYSGVISLPSIRLVCFIAELNGLDLCTVANSLSKSWCWVQWTLNLGRNAFMGCCFKPQAIAIVQSILKTMHAKTASQL